jgi:glycosyltransferase involved in cell wall biosynthesis
LRASIAAHGLSARVRLAGEAPEAALGAAYAGADLFVLPSLYEGYGMVLGEAMARGLPIVTTTGGAAAQTVPDAAALKVPPGDASALREALASAIADASLRARLSDASWLAGQGLPRWRDGAALIAQVLHSIAGAAS